MSSLGIPEMPYRQFSDSIHDKILKDRIPFDGTIELTLRCNLRCVHCYCTYDPSLEEMSYEQICKLLDDVTEAGCLWLLITGGEPLIRKDFLDIYTYAMKKGMIITLFTNGTLITEEIADHLREYAPFAIEISLYGATRQTYEDVTQADGSFERCMNGIRLLVERKLPLVLKTTVTTLNKHELTQMRGFAKSLGVEFRFDPILHPKLDGSKVPCGFRISPEEVLAIDLEDDDRRRELIEICEKAQEGGWTGRLFECGAGQDSFHIDPFGNLRLCDMVRDFSYDLRKGSFKEGWEDYVGKVLLLKHAPGYECGECEVADMCMQCPGWASLENGDLEKPVEYLCEVTRLRVETFGIGKEKKRRLYGKAQTVPKAGAKGD